MPNNKDKQKTGSPSAMGDKPDREFESQSTNKGFGSGQKEQPGRSGIGSKHPTDDDEMNTSGGKEGQFSDKDRGKQGQWSPGSSQPSDQ